MFTNIKNMSKMRNFNTLLRKNQLLNSLNFLKMQQNSILRNNYRCFGHSISKPYNYNSKLMTEFLNLQSNNEIEKDQAQKVFVQWLDKYSQNIYDNLHHLENYKNEYRHLPTKGFGNEKVLNKLIN